MFFLCMCIRSHTSYMWSTNPVFFPCPKHLRFRSLKSLEGNIVEGFDSSFHSSRVGPQLSRAMPTSSFGFCYELIDSIMSFLVIWILYFRMTYTCSCWIDARAMSILWYPFRWYEKTQLFRLFLHFIYIYMCKAGYVTFQYERSMYNRYEIYYVYVEVYVNLQVEKIKVLNFPCILTHECNDMKPKC